MTDMSGLFIAFEGGDGAGKSTQANILAEKLSRQGFRSVLLHEPGSTTLGDYLRRYLIGDGPISNVAELLLFEASRAELMTDRIRPELEAGAIVICDRFTGSTVAYQGHGRGLDLEKIQWLNDLATHGRYPDLTILLDIVPAVGLERVHNRLFQLALPIGDAPDRFEDEELRFHDRVHRGFNRQADNNPKTWRKVEGNQSIGDVADVVWSTVYPMLPHLKVCSETV